MYVHPSDAGGISIGKKMVDQWLFGAGGAISNQEKSSWIKGEGHNALSTRPDVEKLDQVLPPPEVVGVAELATARHGRFSVPVVVVGFHCCFT